MFKLSPELRHAIYSHLIDGNGLHLLRSPQGQFRLLPCLGSDGPNDHIGKERCPSSTVAIRDPVWIRRLASEWGPHWRCEEAALRRDAAATWLAHEALLRVCKRS